MDIAREFEEIRREQIEDEIAAARSMTPEERLLAFFELDVLVSALQGERTARATRQVRDEEKDRALEWMARI